MDASLTKWMKPLFRKGFHDARKRSLSGAWVRLIAWGALAMAGAVPWQAVQAQTNYVSCGEEAYNCTAQDLTGISATATLSSCVIGTWVSVPVTINVTSQGNNERYDIGAWFRGQNQCQTRVTTVGSGNFTNQEGAGADTCGDLKGATGTYTFSGANAVQVYCQPGTDGKLSFPTTLFWSQNKNPAVCDTTPATASKCKTVTSVNNVTFQGQITVKKSAAGATSETFPFSVTGAATPTSFSLGNGGAQTVTATATAAGTAYTITEGTLPAGWQFNSATCTDSDTGAPVGTSASNGVQVTLSHKVNRISCQFTNVKIPPAGQVTLVKDLTAGDPGQFTFSLTGQTSVTSGGSGTKLTGSFNAGSAVAFGEAAAVGTDLNHYTRTYSCVQGSNAITLTGAGDTRSFTMPSTAGGGVTCTIKNERKTRVVKLSKTLIDPALIKGSFNLAVNGAPLVSGVGNYTDTTGVSVAVGSPVTVSETSASGPLSRYTSTLSCPRAGLSSNTGTTGTFTMPDEDIGCTFTNTRLSATLKVAKAWAGAIKAGDKATVVTTEFTNNATAGESSAGTSTTGAGVTVYVGEVGNLTESFGVGDKTHYTQSYACVGGETTADIEGHVGIATADAGKTITCTLTNTRKTNTVTVNKTLSPTTDDGRFTLHINDAPTSISTNVRHGGTTGAVTVPVGSRVSVAELAGQGTALGNYTSVLTCDGVQDVTGATTGSFTMPDAPVTCTFTNTRKTSTVTVTKALMPKDDPGRFTLQINGEATESSSNVGDGGTTGAVSVPVGSTVAVAELAGTNTHLGSYTSVLTCKGVSGVSATTSGSFTMPENPVSCTFTNTRRPAVTAIPTTSPAGLVALALLMLGVAGGAIRRYRR